MKRNSRGKENFAFVASSTIKLFSRRKSSKPSQSLAQITLITLPNDMEFDHERFSPKIMIRLNSFALRTIANKTASSYRKTSLIEPQIVSRIKSGKLSFSRFSSVKSLFSDDTVRVPAPLSNLTSNHLA